MILFAFVWRVYSYYSFGLRLECCIVCHDIEKNGHHNFMLAFHPPTQLLNINQAFANYVQSGGETLFNISAFHIFIEAFYGTARFDKHEKVRNGERESVCVRVCFEPSYIVLNRELVYAIEFFVI